jgi:guanine deaminase
MPNTPAGVTLIKNGRVYDHAGDVDLPPIADLLIVDGVIAGVRSGIAASIERRERVPELGARTVDQTIDATEKLLMPGFVNAHYHSHDVLLKGCFETIPLELWLLSALPPAYPKRSTAEIRARTLLGALECLRSGMTTVQDLATIYPFDEEHLEAILRAYEDIGIRCVFALQFADMPGGKAVPFWEEVVPPEQRAALSGSVEPFQGVDLAGLLRDILKSQKSRHPRITVALGPTSPERCTPELLSKVADMSDAGQVPVYTHIYESRPMTLIPAASWRMMFPVRVMTRIS